METTTLNKKFQSYLDQEMSGEELEAFKNELRSNAEVKKAYIAYLFQALKGTESSDVTSKEWITNVYRESTPVKLEQPGKIYLFNRFVSANWRKMAVAATLIGVSLIYNNDNYSNDSLVADYHVIQSEQVRGSDNDNKVTDIPVLQKAQILIVDEPKSALALLQQTDGSTMMLEDKEEIEWYIALCYLKMDKVDAAKSILMQIANNPSHSYKRKAKQLLNDMNAFWRKLVWSK